MTPERLAKIRAMAQYDMSGIATELLNEVDRQKELREAAKRIAFAAGRRNIALKQERQDLDAENIMCRRVNAELREQIQDLFTKINHREKLAAAFMEAAEAYGSFYRGPGYCHGLLRKARALEPESEGDANG